MRCGAVVFEENRSREAHSQDVKIVAHFILRPPDDGGGNCNHGEIARTAGFPTSLQLAKFSKLTEESN